VSTRRDGRKPLSSIGNVLLRLEDPTNPMMVTGILLFDTPMDLERLRATLERRFLRFDRFRQRVRQPRWLWGTPYWEDDPGFDLNAHLECVKLPPPGDQAALQEVVSQLASTPLDPDRPLWQFHLVEAYGDGCALIFRLHHCIADGVGLVGALLALTDGQPDAPPPVAQPEGVNRRGRETQGDLFRAARWLLHESLETLDRPARVLDVARLGVGSAAVLGQLALRGTEPETPFRGPLGRAKRVAWSAPVPLEDVKFIGRGLGATVNDVLVTAMTGALRRYMQQRHEAEGVQGAEDSASADFHAVIPVNLRPPGGEPELKNEFGSVFLPLPVGIADPIERLYEVKRRMDDLKGSLEAPATSAMLNVLGVTHPRIQEVAIKVLETRATAVMSNVIGPKERIYLAGARLGALICFVPQSGHVGLGVTMLSYAGQVRLGTLTDERLVPDPETIIAGFHAEFEELLALAREAEATPSMREQLVKLEDVLKRLSATLQEIERNEMVKGD
jgi:diacylglycerol O-acyltransferase